MDNLILDKNCLNVFYNLTSKEKNKWIGSIQIDGVDFKFVKTKLIQKFVSQSSNKNDYEIGLKSKSDLIPGVYEGGFKIWESTQDLIKFINQHDVIKPNLKIFDLGCGGGLVGINAVKKGSKHVHFQDFNHKVLSCFTIPNLIINMSLAENDLLQVANCIESTCRFMAGDWALIEKFVIENKLKYDIILSCETIYYLNNYGKLLSLIENSLSDNGEAYIAAKNYYFGVGGGVDQFMQFVNQNSHFYCVIVKTIEAPLTRNILKLTFRKP